MHKIKNGRLYQRLKSYAAYLTTGWRRTALTALLVLFTFAVIAQIFISNRDLLASHEWELRPEWLAYSLIFFLLDLLLSLWVWHLLVSRLANYSNLRQSSRIVLRSNLARRVPGAVWYIANRAVLYQEVGVSKTAVSLLSALELAFFIISGILTTLLTLPFWILPGDILSEISAAWWLLLLLPAGAFLVHPRILGKIWQKLSKQGMAQRLNWWDTSIWLGLYILIWVLGGFVLFCVLNLFQPITINHLIMIIGVWTLANTISLAGLITFSVFGLREVSLIVLLSPIVPTPVALIIAVTIRLIWLTGELLASLLSFKL
jgi:hypothetical protein